MSEKTKTVQFRLREGVDNFGGGTVAHGDGESYDVGKALQEGKGTIEVEEGSPLHAALDAYPALARGAAKPDSAPKQPESKPSDHKKED